MGAVPSRIVLEIADASAGGMMLSDQAARSMIGWLVGEALPAIDLSHRDLAEASNAQNNMATGPHAHQRSFDLLMMVSSSRKPVTHCLIVLDKARIDGEEIFTEASGPLPSWSRIFNLLRSLTYRRTVCSL